MGIKGLHTNCRLASCFVSYVNEHQSDYHGIIWFMFFELLVLCAVNPLLTGGFPYRRPVVWKCVVWLIHFALLVEHWCMIKVSTSLAQCVVSPFVPILLTKELKPLCLLSCLSKRAVEQTAEMQVSRKLMKLRLYYCYVTCPLVIDDITVPVCGETTGHQWIPVARGHWSWTLVVQCAAIPPPVDSPHKSSAWCFFFMFALTSYLTNNRDASELKSLDAYAMPLLCVICQSDIPHGWTSG